MSDGSVLGRADFLLIVEQGSFGAGAQIHDDVIEAIRMELVHFLQYEQPTAAPVELAFVEASLSRKVGELSRRLAVNQTAHHFLAFRGDARAVGAAPVFAFERCGMGSIVGA